MITLPSDTKEWKQANNSDLLGNISFTKNITFDKKGYLQLSNSSRAVMNEAIDADFDEPMVIIRSEDHGYFVQTIDSPFIANDTRFLSVRPTQDATAGIPSGSLFSDATFAGGLLIVTQNNDVKFYDPAANTWTDTNISLTATSGAQHPIEKYPNLSGVAIANVNTVGLYSASVAAPFSATPTLQATLKILSDFYITSLAYFNQNLYVGTMNRSGGHAILYVWNGYGEAAQSAFEVDSNIIYDITVHEDSIVCFTGKGQLLRFNGSGFTQLDALPIFYANQNISDETNVAMLHNCLKSNSDVLYINVTTRDSGLRMTNQPDGIWCYDSALGFMYHRYGLSLALTTIDIVATASVNTTTDVITVADAPITGTEVLYDAVSGTALAPLEDDHKYYVIKTGATTIKLATTKANALAGTAIDLTGTGNNAQILTSFPNIDFGQYLGSRVGAILPIERIVEQPHNGTDLFWGGALRDRALSSAPGYMGSVSTIVENRGYYGTPKIMASGVTDTYNLFTLKFSPFLSDLDSIVIKYRTVDDRRDSINIPTITTDWCATWTSSMTFTTTETDFADAVVGDEVEFLQGAASGIMAHITAISPSAGTYTVTIDEEFENYTSGDKSTFIFRNWTKWKEIVYGDNDAENGYVSEQLGISGKFIQFKVELRGVQVRIEQMAIDDKYLLPSRS